MPRKSPRPIRGVTALDGTTKAKIERAALTLFVEGKMDQMTTKAIAQRAGVAEGSLYNHYASKQDIWLSLFTALHTRLGTLVKAAKISDPSIREQVRSLVHAYCQTADNDWDLFSFHLLTMHRFLGQMRKRPTSAVYETEQLILNAIQQKQIAKGDEKLLAAMSLGVVLQTALHRVYGRITKPMMYYHEQMTVAILAILSPLGDDE